MCNFVVERLERIIGKKKFYKLILNKKCALDLFENEIKNNKLFYKEFEKLYALFNIKAKGENLPKEKFHNWNISNCPLQGFEFKTKHLRVYGVIIEENYVIINAGTKNTQDTDKKKFEKISSDNCINLENSLKTIKLIDNGSQSTHSE